MFTLPHRQAFIFTLLLSVLLLTGCGGGGGAGTDASSTGIDTDSDGFVNSVDVDDNNNGLIEISSLEQLDWMRNDLAGASLTDNVGNIDTRGCPVDGCHGYELIADLNFDTNDDGVMDDNDTYYDNGSGWQPIGNKAHRFTADFNGNGHSIHNLYINRPTTNFNGLFSFVDGAGNTITLKDVILDGILMSITGKNYTGSLVGVVADAAIHNITINGEISGADFTGGLLGTAFTNVSIDNCTSGGTVYGVDSTGGLIGSIELLYPLEFYIYPSISDSKVNSRITGKTNTGVFIGKNVEYASISNSSATGQDDSDYDSDGVRNGVDVDDDDDGLIEISSLEQLDWMRNDLAGTSLNDGVGNADSTGCPTTDCHGYELIADLDFDTNGDGVMDSNDTYDNNGSGWQPVGYDTYPFTADFNGNGHTIHNLYINRPTENYNGLFGVVYGANSANVIQNVNLKSVLVTGYYNTGGLVGTVSASTIINCSASGTVTGNANYTGGLIGSVGSSTISNSSASAAVTGNSITGGLVGYIDSGSINNCSTSGVITGNTHYTGGLVGEASGADISISNSSATGAVNGHGRYTGGLVGDASGSNISNSWASGAVTGNSLTGGLIGRVNSSTVSTNIIIENSFATGSVTATSDYFVGGLIGGLIGSTYYKLTLNNSFATGEVTGFSYVGGLIGEASGNTSITHNFATGKVTYDLSTQGTSGALAGSADATTTFDANYFARDKGLINSVGVNGVDPYDHNPAGTTGASLAELQCPTSANDTTCAASPLYENWDTALWDFGSNIKLPGLVIGGTVYRDGDGKGLLDNNLAPY